MAPLTPEQRDLARGRVRQLFGFLKAYAERRTQARRRLSDHEWMLRLRDLPAHPCVVRGEVLLNPGAGAEREGGGNGALLTVRRPRLTKAPVPPNSLWEWLENGWQEPDGAIVIRSERYMDGGSDTVAERFDADETRVAALAQWRARWNDWAAAERPARAVMREFERLYRLYSQIRLESERVELVLGDGVLRWQCGSETLDHPVLLQRVELQFDEQVPELRLVDADRAPELYAAMLDFADGLAPSQLIALREEVEARGFHPLEQEATTGFLERLAHQLGPRGALRTTPSGGVPSADPIVERDPVLFLRQREVGYAAAFDRVLRDLEDQTIELPVALTRLVGVEPPEEPESGAAVCSPWGEPPDILLSKPANAEQIAIARALERHRAVQVQGPPGTGKSHTIANLIGHLVAHGKRVLVTSHTTKALSVLRHHIVEPLRPLAVAVLENDLEGRTQMEESVKQILARLTEPPERLAANAQRLTAERGRLNARIDEVTAALQDARIAEYQPIVVGGEAFEPADAARWVRDHRTGNDWIRGPVSVGAPLPLAPSDVIALYASNAHLSAAEETEIAAGLPAPGDLASPGEFAALVARAADGHEGDGRRFWAAEPAEAQLQNVQALDAALCRIGDEIKRLAPWELEVVKAGHDGAADQQLWEELVHQIRKAHALWNSTKPLQVAHDPRLPHGAPSVQLMATYQEIEEYLAGGRVLGWFTLLTRGEWKLAIKGSRVNGAEPSERDHFRALRAEAELRESRRKLKVRWVRQAEPAGLPTFDSLGDVPEAALLDYAERIEVRLSGWREWWRPLELAMEAAGLQWRLLRDDALARSAPTDSFGRDLSLVAAQAPPIVRRRLAACLALQASRLLDELERGLRRFRGPAASGLHFAVASRDPEAYADSLRRLERLRDKVPLYEQRRTLLATLETVATAWAAAIRAREGVHGVASPPGDAAAAWRWCQLQQELERRATLDEQALGARLDQLRADLRRTTAELIEQMAWKQQVERVDLRGRQSLQGWADIQRRIGRGTGRRVPDLQREARKLLESAREAVPVWIMPLARVIDSFSPSTGRFDVVIVDEASQSDMLGLLAWYLGDRIVVVGDNEQVSPLAVGEQIDSTAALIDQYLANIPNAIQYDGKSSVYDFAGQCFGQTIRLREHFRCVPAIIEFSNRLSYNGEIRPLRNPASAPQPHVVECVTPPSLGTVRDGKRNQAEARMVVALLAAMIEHDTYRKKTFGAISLLGEEQAGLIQELALTELGAVELEARRFVAGSAAQFQGDERDVMLLSMVDTPTGAPLRIRQEQLFKQRYNVAASRARDQLWLVHSLDPNRDLKDGDLRRELIAHVRDPEARLRKEREALARAESPFEQEVIKRVGLAGYEVTPQVWVGNYRIDLVVGSGRNLVAVECDGDRYHGIDRIPDDMARQAILERAGWRFVRIRGTRFYRDPDSTMKWVVGELTRLGAAPSTPLPEEPSAAGAELREQVVRRAWEIIRERGWTPAAPSDDPPPAVMLG